MHSIDTETYFDTAAPLVPQAVLYSKGAAVLAALRQPGIELALWQRGADPRLAALVEWLQTLPPAQLPVCRMNLQPAEAVAKLNAAFDISDTPHSALRWTLVADIADLVARFAAITGCDTVRLRLDAIPNNACRRWHRDCVPLRLITTYRGPGTEWVAPGQGQAVIAQPDLDAPYSAQVAPLDVALFKGCGWPEAAHDSGIVHRSPPIEGLGLTRLVLVLNLPLGAQEQTRAKRVRYW